MATAPGVSGSVIIIHVLKLNNTIIGGGRMMQLTLDKCALCHSKDKLELSHIIPKFVYRYFKDTAIGKLRSVENPNATVQDGEKHYMLCGACEDLFSSCEKQFADNIFYPYMKEHQRRFEYDTWLHFFLTSISWRHLYLDLLDFVENQVVGLDALEHLIDSEKMMRDYLLGKRNDVGSIEHHLFFFEDIATITDELKGLQPHVSIHRSVCGYSAANEETKTYYSFTNMMGVILFTLYNKGQGEVWENTQVFNKAGVIEAKNQHITSVCGQEIEKIMHDSEASKDKISQKQQEKIKERLQKAAQNITQYPIFNDFKKDREL